MNATNRFVNRSVLFLVGAALLIAGAVALAAGVLSAGDPPAWVRRPAAEVAAAWESVDNRTWQVMGIGPVPMPLLFAAAAALVLTVLLVVFLISRRRGRSKTVLDVHTATGRTTVDRNVVDAVLTEPLIRRPDVLSARTGTYRVGQTRAVELAVTVRPGLHWRTSLRRPRRRSTNGTSCWGLESRSCCTSRTGAGARVSARRRECGDRVRRRHRPTHGPRA